MENGEQELELVRTRRRNFITRLRSGRDPQGQGILTRIDMETGEITGYCCLGVACVQAIEDGLQLEVTHHAGARRYDNEGGILPPAVYNWYQFTSSPSLDSSPLKILEGSLPSPFTAVGANDSLRLTFLTIADLFEATYLPEDWAATLAARGQQEEETA